MEFGRTGTEQYAIPLDPDNPNDARTIELELIGLGKRVLELGCAGGLVTRALAARRCSVVGVEIDEAGAARAEPHAERMIVADLDGADPLAELTAERFDVVLAGDVLEHLRDPLRVLQAARELLRDDGALVVSLPNVAHADVRLNLLAGRFPYSPTGLLDRTHLRFFTRESAYALLHDAGFVVVDARRTTTPMFGSEIAPDPAAFPGAAVEFVSADPDADTYQFVLKAVAVRREPAFGQLTARCRALEAELATALDDLRAEQGRRAEVERRAAELQGHVDHWERRLRPFRGPPWSWAARLVRRGDA
jgi:2-polyprenyl-3-methyl-5-hydroxy-6-metoxy-1,4-benzoquinol methylase